MTQWGLLWDSGLGHSFQQDNWIAMFILICKKSRLSLIFNYICLSIFYLGFVPGYIFSIKYKHIFFFKYLPPPSIKILRIFLKNYIFRSCSVHFCIREGRGIKSFFSSKMVKGGGLDNEIYSALDLQSVSSLL